MFGYLEKVTMAVICTTQLISAQFNIVRHLHDLTYVSSMQHVSHMHGSTDIDSTQNAIQLHDSTCQLNATS